MPPAPSEPRPFASYARLLPFARADVPRLALGTGCALGASVMALVVPQVLRWLVDHPLASGDRTQVYLAGAAVLALGALEAGLWRLRRRFTMRPALRVERTLRNTLYRRLQDLPVAFHDRWESGQLLSRATADLGVIRRWLAFALSLLIVNSLMTVAGFAILIAMNPLLGVVYLVCATPAAWFGYRFERVYSVLSRRSQDQVGELATAVEQSVHGIRVLKAFGRGGTALDRFTGQASALRDTELRKADAVAGVWVALTFVPQFALAVCLGSSIWAASAGDMTVGQITAFFVTAATLSWPIESLGFLMAEWVNARTAVDRVFDILDTRNTVRDPAGPVTPEARAGTLRFEDVHFRYDDARPGEPDLLDGVSLTVRPGETMALVGLTGSGKSLLTELVPRLHDTTAGRILLDGVDVRDMARDELRSRVAVAFEEPTLFSQSVRENVLMGDPDATEDRLAEALRVARAGFVAELPDGVDTLVGEEGHSLSGGQRQRLALARAILARPEVLVLDDPLSALDVDTEAAVERGLRTVLADTTTLVVAHRASTVALADRVAVLRAGRIDDVGTHAELLARSEHYRYVISNLERDGREPLDDRTRKEELR